MQKKLFCLILLVTFCFTERTFKGTSYVIENREMGYRCRLRTGMVLPTALKGWRTNWTDFLAQGHLVPGSAASEDKKSVKFEPLLAL